MAIDTAGPEKIGRYQILGELGRGAMGRVYRAFDPNIGRNIALKVILLDSTDPELAMRFRREAQASGILSHPNIVTIFDAGDDNGFLYIAMELVEGQTLQQLLAQGPLPIGQVVSYCEQAGAALDHAHARAIIHRDIKPANIMVQAGVVKVTDFGVAKSGAAGMTSTGQVLGTPQYLAPEVVRGGVANARSDIFSLGVVLYEMLTGQRAFAGDNVSTVIYRIMAEQPPAPSSIVSSVPAGVNYVVQKALAKEPDERYRSCAELVADLKNHPELEELGKAAAQQVNAPPPFPELLAKTASVDLGATQPQTQAVPAQSIPAPLASKKKWEWAAGGLAAVLVIGAILWRGRSSIEPPPATTSPAAPTTMAPALSPAMGSAPGGGPSQPAATPGGAGSASPAASAPARQSTVPTAAAVMGRVVIHTDPAGARIIVNGKPTPYRSPVNFGLEPGQYQITAEHDGYASVTKSVVVKANGAAQVRLALKRSEDGGILHRLPLVR
jgi:eukaryotic-like serine/threonine-protein kinase